jgi:hypothetical protein
LVSIAICAAEAGWDVAELAGDGVELDDGLEPLLPHPARHAPTAQAAAIRGSEPRIFIKISMLCARLRGSG